MIKPEQVPDEAWRATGLPELPARAVIAAAINAWPGGHSFTNIPRIVIPLPKKNTND